MSETFKFGNKQWYGKKGSVLAYNDENNNFKPLPFDFTRSSSATRVNKDGLIEVVGSDEPRVDYLNNADGHLLLEPSRTNLVTQSEEVNLTAGWSFSSGGTGSLPVITSNDAVAPDGNTTADKVVLDMNGGTTGSDWSFIAFPYTSAVATFTMTCYLKGVNGGEEIFFDFDNGNSNLITLTTEWVRYEFTKTVNYTTTRYIRIGLRGSDTTDDTASFYMWGCQLEQGSYATSYIPTSGSSVTRAADAASQDVPTGIINSTQGTMYFEGSSSESNISYIYFLSLSDGTLNNRFEIRQSAAVLQFLWRVGGVYQNQISKSGIDITTNFKVAVRYSSTDIVMYYNGEKVGTITSPTLFSANTLDRIAFDEGDGGKDLTGTVKDVRLYDTPLIDSELQALTTL